MTKAEIYANVLDALEVLMSTSCVSVDKSYIEEIEGKTLLEIEKVCTVSVTQGQKHNKDYIFEDGSRLTM